MRAVNKLAKLLVSPATSKTGTPLRYARGVVVSSNMGQSVVTLDGGATNVTAFNYGHAQSLPAGTVVDVRVDGTKLYVIGAFDASGWTTVSVFTNSWTAVAGNTPRYILVGRLVYVNGIVTGGTANTAAFTLPAGYRPSQAVHVVSAVSSAGTGVINNINSSGNYTCNQNSSSSTNVILDCSFPAV